jgi:glycosyl hydrolase family 39 (putative alpha-L-iduronidase)
MEGDGGALRRRVVLKAAAAPLAAAPAASRAQDTRPQGQGRPGRAATAAARRVPLVASARPQGGPGGAFRTADFGLVGVFDADWLLDARYARLLDAMAASPGGFVGVRFFGILNSGEREATFPTTSGRVWPAEPPDAPVDLSVAMEALGALASRGLVPFVALTFFPAAVSSSPIEPPTDLSRWQTLVRAFLDRAVERFGAEEVSRWWFEAWNEPNMPPFWRGDFDRYLDLYRATAEAVRDSGHRVRLGGPAIAWMPPRGDSADLMQRFLEFLRAEPEVQCDFLSYHRKGIWTNEETEPRLERLVAAAETTAELALRLVPERCAHGLPLVNNEADMKVGFDHPYEPRMSERFPAWLAATAVVHAGLTARYAGRGLRFLAAADNANQHLVREPFDGRRSLATRTSAAPDDLVKLPVFAFYELLRLLGGRLGTVGQAGDAPLLPRGDLHHLVTADEHRIGALLTRFPAEGAGDGPPLRLDYALRDIPWPRVNLAVFRIDATHANAFAAAGRRMPARIDPGEEARRLRAAAELGVAAPLRSGVPVEDGRLRVPVELGPDATALVWVTPFDPRPPPEPRWLAATAERGNAVLRWTPNREPGFYGYELLRMTPGRGRAKGDAAGVVAPMPLRSAMWVDTAPPPGAAHVYGVRAVSASGARSPLALSPPVRV